MAIVKMKKLRLLAMRTDQERLLHQLQLFGNVEVSEQPVDSTDPEWAGLLQKNEAALSEKKAAVTRAANALAVLDQYAYVKTSFFAVPRQVGEDDLFDQALPVEAQDRIGKIEDAQARLSGLYTAQGRAENELRSLQLWLPLDVPLDVRDTAHVAFRFGTVPAASDMAAVQAALLAATESCALYEAGRDREQIGVFLIYYAQEEQALEQALRAVAFSPVHWPGYTGSAKENAAALERRLDETRGQISATRKELEACGTYRETIQLYLERARQDLASEEAKAELLHTETAFSLTGWVPAEQEEQLLALLRQYDCAWELSEPEEAEYPDVPVKLKNNRFTRALNMVTEMYSLPAYDGVDPNPLMAPFFILFYGVMLADMGYGLLMILAAIVVKAKKKPQGGTRNFFDLMLYCGISTFVVGLLTGGFFGDAPLQVARILNPDTTWQGLPALFNPLDDTVMILLGSMALALSILSPAWPSAWWRS